MLPHAARTIHFAAIPIPSTVPSATSESIEVLNERARKWTKNGKYEGKMKKSGKMSIMPILDWMKNMPSKHGSVAAAIAKGRLGHMRLASRYIIGMYSVPKRRDA